MENPPITVKHKDLQPGMAVIGVVSLSAEYGYLDSRRVAMLKQRFKGALVSAVRMTGPETVPIEEILPGDQITSITQFPDALGYGAIDAAQVAQLVELGFLEFEVTAGPSLQKEPAATATDTAPARPRTSSAPAFASAKGMKHMKSVAEVRFFLEQVEDADNERFKSTEMVREMLEQGRGGHYSTKPATEAVESILRKNVGGAMAAVAGLKSSDQTYAHCIDMSAIFNEAANGIIRATGQPINQSVARSTLAAGFMHDIGKSRVPKDILDSTVRFAPDSLEMQIMRSHVEHSAQILSDAGADKAMINVAHYHHVKMDTSLPASYPKITYDQVMPLTRLAAIVDVYQALIGKRSYKKNWVPGKAVDYIRSLESTEFDPNMLANFLKVIGKYPVGSLVRLSTGDLAFVTKVEGQHLERPVVVVVENAKGELLSTNPLADLMAEPDISIVELLDHYEHFNDSATQAFDIFKSLKVI